MMPAFSSGIARVSDAPPPRPVPSACRFMQAMARPAKYVAEYLRGNGKTDDNECAKLFKDYQKCLHVGPPPSCYP